MEADDEATSSRAEWSDDTKFRFKDTLRRHAVKVVTSATATAAAATGLVVK